VGNEVTSLAVVNGNVGSEGGGLIVGRESSSSDDEDGSIEDEVELGSSKDEVYALDKYPAVKSLLPDDTHLSRAPRHKHNAQDPHDGMDLHFWGRGGKDGEEIRGDQRVALCD
jgi:hypothetical protein